jgi:ketosteroid isomerase-like protein
VKKKSARIQSATRLAPSLALPDSLGENTTVRRKRNQMTIKMRSLLAILLLAIPVVLSTHSTLGHGTELDKDRAAIEKTSRAVRAAFAQGDVDTIMLYHHPEVNKALAWNKYLVGRDAVAADLRATFQNYHLEFLEDKTESLRIHGDTAIQQDVVSIKGTPKQEGKPFLFKGRALVILVRYDKSPTGWATIHEMIQPAPPDEEKHF